MIWYRKCIFPGIGGHTNPTNQSNWSIIMRAGGTDSSVRVTVDGIGLWNCMRTLAWLKMAIEEMVSDNLVVSVFLFAITFYVAKLFINRGTGNVFKIPKGPPAIPFFGNSLSLKSDDEFLNQLNDFSKQYGCVYSLYLGRQLAVVVNGWEKIKEVIVDSGLEFADKSSSNNYKRINPNMLGRTLLNTFPILIVLWLLWQFMKGFVELLRPKSAFSNVVRINNAVDRHMLIFE